MDYKQFHESVYARDNAPGESNGWIQWKGTDVCIDLYCKCGHEGHFDGEMFYYYTCPDCNAKYAVGQNVKLIELNNEEADSIEISQGFSTDTD